ncbi:MAG: iron uptake transporter permease EfeU [Candidatus Limnocylindria bacterium]
MEFGALGSGLITGLREGVEAALIVAIILAYLDRTGNRRHFQRVYVGVGAAIAFSAVIGILLWVTIGGLPPPTEQVFEAAAMILATGVVTWMLFWMRRVAANMRGELQAAVDRSLTDASVWGLSILAFTAVVREGVETSLFLLGQVAAASSDPSGALAVLLGALIGLALAVGIGFGFYRGAHVINLRTFFRWTGVALIFIAAGLLSHAVHELVEIGVITVGTDTAFDLSAILPHSGEGFAALVGSLLRAMFGYTSQPEWVTFLTWLGYIVIVIPLYLRPVRPAEAASRPVEQTTAKA